MKTVVAVIASVAFCSGLYAQSASAISPTHNTVTVRYGIDALPYWSDCTTTLKDSGGSPVDTDTLTEGASRRESTFTSLTASTDYKLSIACDGTIFDWASDVDFTTEATPGGSLTVPIQFGAPSVPNATRITVDYGTTPAVSDGSQQNTNCGSGCTVDLTLAQGLQYYRWKWQNVADDVLATSQVQSIAVGESAHDALLPGTQTLAILDSFEKPFYANGFDWVTSTSVKLSKGEMVGYVVRLANDTSMPTGDFTTLYRMVRITIRVPSFSGGEVGIFYDALVELSAANLSGTKYVYAEYEAPGVAGSDAIDLVQSGETVTVNTTVFDYALAESNVRLYMELPNVQIWRGHHGEYASPAEPLGLLYSPMAVEHRVTPYGMYVFALLGTTGDPLRLDYGSGGLSFTDYVLAFTPQDFMIPGAYSTTTYIGAAEEAVTQDAQNAWWYVMDEPTWASEEELESRLTNVSTYSPSMKSMVTTRKDYGPNPPLVPEPDIYCPVVDQFENGTHPNEADYSADELWLYTSCMEHGCSDNRDNCTDTSECPLVSGNDSGRPGMVIDHPVAYIYAFILLPIKYTSIAGLLYYNMVENYDLYLNTEDPPVDPWTDNFNFGGNGDGTLFYPWRDGMYGNATDQPTPSFRLKKIRDAMVLLDYAKAAGAASVATCGGGALITDTDTWEQDAKAWQTFRSCLITELGY
jgi:hypothetical protein